MSHIPVLVAEVLNYLNAEQPGIYIDGTVGNGGHLTAILQSHPKNRVLGIDLDQTSLEKLRSRLVQESLDQRATLVQGNYRDLDKIAHANNLGPVNGILLDLGFSSDQVDAATRGFSFQADGPLDMRYDLATKRTAGEIVNHYYPAELERIFKDYGEERFAGKIAHSIVRYRQTAAIQTTHELAEIIRQALPPAIRFKVSDSQRRVFQALRIEVNDELRNLTAVLPKTLELLKPGGRLVVISFQSLEDRIVKDFFNQEARDCVCPPEFPTCICDKTPTLKILTRKPVTATAAELTINSRSKPAKLRAAEKINQK